MFGKLFYVLIFLLDTFVCLHVKGTILAQPGQAEKVAVCAARAMHHPRQSPFFCELPHDAGFLLACEQS